MDQNQKFQNYCDDLIGSIRSSEWSEASFNSRALQLFELQFESIPVYRSFCESKGRLPTQLASWQEIPPIPARAFKEFEITSIPVEERSRVFLSSGTTQANRSQHFHDAKSLKAYHASLITWFDSRVKQRFPNLNYRFLTPIPSATPHSSLNHMFEVLNATNGGLDQNFLGELSTDGGWLVPESTPSRLRSESQPFILFGTAFSFVHLLDMLGPTPLPMPRGSVIFETGGYKGRSRQIPKTELYDEIRKKLGIESNHIVCEYGMSELNSQAYDLPGPDGTREFAFPPWARAQIVSPENGRPVSKGDIGLLRIFDLANVRSVLALETEDLAVQKADAFELIGRPDQTEPRGCSLMPEAAITRA